MNRPGRTLAGSLGTALVVLAFAASLVHVLRTSAAEDDGVETIRLCHWQLELGYREAMDETIADYERLQAQRGRRVRVIQMPIGGDLYGPWINTRLIAGDAPDLVEMAGTRLTRESDYVARFFRPLGEAMSEPNAYDDGTAVAGQPWRDTFLNGARNGWFDDLQDFYAAPLHAVSIRLCWNVDLLRAATGSADPPRSLGTFLDACAAIRRWAASTRRDVVPIAGARIGLVILLDRYRVPFTAALQERLDTDLDGVISPRECYAGLVRGDVTLQDPAIRGMHECLRALCAECTPGFLGMGREQATFQFVQQRAVAIPTGSWDAETMLTQAQGRFALAFSDYPLPAPGERWSQVSGAHPAELDYFGATYAIARRSRHGELALDFLRYLTSVGGNELLNRRSGWLPDTVGAAVDPRLAVYAPHLDGATTSVEYAWGSYASVVLAGRREQFLLGEIGYDDFARDVTAALLDPQNGGDRAWAQERQAVERRTRMDERVLGLLAIRAEVGGDDQARMRASRALIRQVALNRGETLRTEFTRLRGRPLPPP